jgi:tetratricopeptide (TPR) repeat protein
MSASLGAGGGLAYASFSNGSASTGVGGLAPYWSVQGELGYRFTPSVSLGALGGYTEILGTKSPVFKGLTAGLRLSVGLDFLGGASSGLSFDVVKQEPLFPITYYKSEQVPVATVRIANLDVAEIREVTVTFSAGEFTSRPTPCGTYAVLDHNQSVDVPLLAAFNDKVLGFTETTKIQGEVRIDYKVLDAQRSETKAVTVVFHNRNTAVWSDPQMVGAFISPQDPVMLELSKYVAGLVRVRAIPEIDKGFQFGMGIFEGLRVYGLVWAADASSPYTAVRGDTSKLAYVQYPAQTLSYKSGDSDAIALTVAEALESIAIPAAIAALPEDVIVAFPLDMGEAQARATFSNIKNFIFDASTVWVPLRASLIRDGFLRAWQGGADLWRAQTGPRPRLVRVEEAWKTFTPVPLPAIEFKPVKPAEEQITQAFDKALSRFATSEVDPKVLRIMAGVYGEPTGSQRNSLGIVYAQYGNYDQAREHFQKAVALGYAPAIINLANVAFLRKDYAAAAAGFEDALKSSPSNKNVLLSLARCRYELGDYVAADEAYKKVRAIDPALADRFSYLSAQVAGSDKGG